MRQGKCVLVVVLMASAEGWARDSTPEITVHVYNKTDLPEDKVTRALAEAGLILKRAGIGVNWMRCGGAAGCQESADPRLMVFSINADAPADMHDAVMGFAMPFTARGNHAAAFSAKVARFSQDHSAESADTSSVLGAVAAHELGHLLLRSNEHGDGIMRAVWQVESARAIAQRRLTFTPAQSRNMRQGLQQRFQAFRRQQEEFQRASAR